jgi:hypothetical protein
MTTSATNVARQNVEMGERREPLEYYVYISDTKVDMLMAQVVERAVANATFTLEERIVRLRTVVRDLRIHNIIGTVADESEYIEGIANLSWGTMAFGSERRSFAFFVGEVGGDLLLLLGSTHNIIGVPRISRHIGASHYFWIMQILQKLDAEQQSAHKSTRDEVSHLISIFVKAEYPRQRLRFFAKRYGKYKAFTVGSPVFVAMAD